MKVTENNIFTLLSRGSWIFLAILVVCGALLASTKLAAGILAGGLIAIMNAYWLYSILQRALHLPPRQGLRFAQVRYCLRLAVIGITVSVLIIYFGIDVLGLLIGLSIVVVNIIVLTGFLLRNQFCITRR